MRLVFVYSIFLNEFHLSVRHMHSILFLRENVLVQFIMKKMEFRIQSVSWDTMSMRQEIYIYIIFKV